MSKVFKFILVVVSIFALSLILTPLVHAVCPFFKFEKIFNRLVMIFSVSAATVFLVRHGLKERGAWFDPELWRVYGFDFSVPYRRLFSYGFVLGVAAVILITSFEIAFGPRTLRSPFLLQDMIERFFKGMLSGFLVGVIEEFFFRGFIFVHMRKVLNTWIAVIAASAFYSLTHFFDNGQIFIPKNPSIHDAFRLLVGYLEPFMRPLDILPEFAGLFLFGVLLTVAFIRSGSLFLSIGLHAGSVFLVKFQHSFIRKEPEGAYHLLFGLGADYDGLFEWMVLILLGCFVWWWTGSIARSSKRKLSAH